MMGGCRSSAGRTFLLSIKGYLNLHSDYTILTDITKRSRSVEKAVMIISGAMGRADNVRCLRWLCAVPFRTVRGAKAGEIKS